MDNRLKRFRMLDQDEFQEMLKSLSQSTSDDQSKVSNAMDSIGGMQLASQFDHLFFLNLSWSICLIIVLRLLVTLTECRQTKNLFRNSKRLFLSLMISLIFYRSKFNKKECFLHDRMELEFNFVSALIERENLYRNSLFHLHSTIKLTVHHRSNWFSLSFPQNSRATSDKSSLSNKSNKIIFIRMNSFWEKWKTSSTHQNNEIPRLNHFHHWSIIKSIGSIKFSAIIDRFLTRRETSVQEESIYSISHKEKFDETK